MSMRKYIGTVAIIALALVIAACDSPLDDGDDADDVETPTTDVVDDAPADDVEADDAVTDDAAVDDAVADDDDAVEADDADVTPEAEATDEADDVAVETDDADEILERAAERAEELETASFELDGTGYLDIEEVGEISLSNAEGQVERPDRAQIIVNVDAEIAEVPIEVLSSNGNIYMTNPITGEWEQAPDDFQFNPAVMFSEDQGLPALIRSVSDAEVLDTEEVEGREAYKIYGIISEETINAGTGGMFRAEGDVDFNVWIDTETYDVLKVLAEDPTDETDNVWEMRIFAHDEPVDIAEPDADDS